MYKEIEKLYKKRINVRVFDIVTVAMFLLLVLVTAISNKNIVLQIVLSLIVILTTLVIVYIVFVVKSKPKNVFLINKNIKEAIKKKQEKNAEIFNQILIEYNIKTEKQLREVMEYYKLQLPQKSKINIPNFLWGIGITLLTILLTCIEFKEDGALNIYVTGNLLGVACVFIVGIVFIIVLVQIFKDLYLDLFDKYDVYENFVEMLSCRLVYMEEPKIQVQPVEKKCNIKKKKVKKK